MVIKRSEGGCSGVWKGAGERGPETNNLVAKGEEFTLICVAAAAESWVKPGSEETEEALKGLQTLVSLVALRLQTTEMSSGYLKTKRGVLKDYQQPRESREKASAETGSRAAPEIQGTRSNEQPGPLR